MSYVYKRMIFVIQKKRTTEKEQKYLFNILNERQSSKQTSNDFNEFYLMNLKYA